MFRVMLEAAIRGAMEKLHMNPRNLRLYFIVDDEEHIIARIDARQVHNLLSRRGRDRKIRFTMGDVSYEVNL